jgi:glyoxylase-like metal-dependent hydrolase (beta-lactamase superfamily II)
VEEIAEGVHWVATGRGVAGSNVYLVRSGRSWVLVDTAWPGRGPMICEAAASVFGSSRPPAAILLTHIHPDHSGSARQLAETWSLPVHVRPEELPMAAGELLPEYANPLDRWLVGPVLRLLPRRRVVAMQAKGSLVGMARALPPDVVPGLPGWEAIPTPGHTPGHVAFFRPEDRVLLTGDAVLTVNLNTLPGLLWEKPQVSGPPRYTTWDWTSARRSVEVVAALDPLVLAPGHGRPLVTGTTPALRRLATTLT